MRERERKILRRRLDVELRSIRKAGSQKDRTVGLLKIVRQALGAPVEEIAGKMGVVPSAVFALETREVKQTAMMGNVARMAKAMGCKLVYGIVPENGKTLEWLAEERLWIAILGKEGREHGIAIREEISGKRG